MKVTDISQIKALAPSKVLRESGRPASADRAGAGDAGDRVSTDDTSRVTAAIAQASAAAGVGHAAKLQVIAASVKQGTYRPDPQRIAQEILDDAELAARLQALFTK